MTQSSKKRFVGDCRSLLENLDLFFVFSHAEKFLQNDSPANKNSFRVLERKKLEKNLIERCGLNHFVIILLCLTYF